MWTTDTFLQNLARFSVLKGQGVDRSTAVGRDPRPSRGTHGLREGPTAFERDPRPSGRTHGRRGGPTAVGEDPWPSGRTHGRRERPGLSGKTTAVGKDHGCRERLLMHIGLSRILF